jgi:hypothetical protein
MSETVGQQLVHAIAARDPAAIADCFSREAEFHALTPTG